MVTAPVRREVVRAMVTRGLSERRALTVVRMSASSLRYVPAPDRNAALRARIVALAHRHRRYGAGMIYLKLRQRGERANHKRVDRLYAEARLQVKRRRRKKVPQADRQPLVRPQECNEVWSADFVFDRTAEGRVLKCLTIVDDATTEAVAIVPARALGGLPVTRVFDRLALVDGLADVRSFGQPQQVIEPGGRRQVQDAFRLICGGLIDARASAAAAGFLLQHRVLREKPDLGEAQEDQAEDRLRVLSRREAGVRAQLVCGRPEAILQRLRAGVLFSRGNPLHQVDYDNSTPGRSLGILKSSRDLSKYI